MPTGYTADIKNGISFKEFALNCTRAFGVCIDLRDNPKEKIPDVFPVNDFYLKKVTELTTELLALDKMTPEELEKQAFSAWLQAESVNISRLNKIQELRLAYEATKAQVLAWTPPTSDHVELRNFMLSQIETSIEHDCSSSYFQQPIKQQTGQEWAADKQKHLKHLITHYESEHKREVEQAEKRTAWMQALRDSLNSLQEIN